VEIGVLTMLYIFTLAVISIWMVILLRKRQLSLHSLIAAYAIAVFTADMFEVLFNLLLELYKFPTHLRANPIDDNELGIIFGDTLILPFAFIIFVYYASKTSRPWITTLKFSALYIILEWVYIKLGYMKYLHWNLGFSAVFYLTGYRFGAFLAPRISSYNPPVPYWARLLCFSHMIIMWVGAIFASPLLKLFQFKPGVFDDFMADCRFTDLLSGDVLAVLCTVLIPRVPRKLKPLAFLLIACIGFSFALFSYQKGWLIYRHWNHWLTALRYIVPIVLIMLYDRWESSYQTSNRTPI
jgi:hypothetical protein